MFHGVIQKNNTGTAFLRHGVFIAAQWRHRLGSKENRGFCELHLTPPVFYPILGVFPLHQTAPVGVSESRDPKLFGRAN